MFVNKIINDIIANNVNRPVSAKIAGDHWPISWIWLNSNVWKFVGVVDQVMPDQIRRGRDEYRFDYFRW